MPWTREKECEELCALFVNNRDIIGLHVQIIKIEQMKAVDMDYHEDPGPVDLSVLSDQDRHRSSYVQSEWYAPVQFTEHGRKLNTWTVKHPGVIEHLRHAGFFCVSRLRRVQLDQALLGALIERWRRETQTFHLHHGEMTVMLRDVAIIAGLRVSGEPVIGRVSFDLLHTCELLLRIQPNNVIADQIRLEWLFQHFWHIPLDAPAAMVAASARRPSLGRSYLSPSLSGIRECLYEGKGRVLCLWWNMGLRFRGNVKAIDIEFYRDKLDQYRESQVTWMPYTEDVLIGLPAFCLEGSTIWRSRTSLICFHIVELHLPDRVLRQFGLLQHIPEAVEAIQRITSQGKSGEDLVAFHPLYIQRWADCLEHIAEQSPFVDPDPIRASSVYAMRHAVSSIGHLMDDPPEPTRLMDALAHVRWDLESVLESLPTLPVTGHSDVSSLTFGAYDDIPSTSTPAYDFGDIPSTSSLAYDFGDIPSTSMPAYDFPSTYIPIHPSDVPSTSDVLLASIPPLIFHLRQRFVAMMLYIDVGDDDRVILRCRKGYHH
ncbi:serine/threonine-protein phosphatase 7 long form homolog [Ananas comosus]|uniref:Serine/threonine-protein phosphatase 7 long form homolog n=1 Tax=Ananas comosus TaxID=4615 RepID=A0A6P5EI49_ANACO|nr:serine/threonine-protein phosphatase 7 long form homolog [Ananas comosus]